MAVQTRVNPAETYEADFAEWSVTQANALRRRAFDELDWENLAEEIGSLARQDKHAIRSHLRNLLMHLIKLAVQPERSGSSWRASIINSRREIADLIEQSPSLRSYRAEVFPNIRMKALEDAAEETGLAADGPSLPAWTAEQLLAHGFFPE